MDIAKYTRKDSSDRDENNNNKKDSHPQSLGNTYPLISGDCSGGRRRKKKKKKSGKRELIIIIKKNILSV